MTQGSTCKLSQWYPVPSPCMLFSLIWLDLLEDLNRIWPMTWLLDLVGFWPQWQSISRAGLIWRRCPHWGSIVVMSSNASRSSCLLLTGVHKNVGGGLSPGLSTSSLEMVVAEGLDSGDLSDPAFVLFFLAFECALSQSALWASAYVSVGAICTDTAEAVAPKFLATDNTGSWACDKVNTDPAGDWVDTECWGCVLLSIAGCSAVLLLCSAFFALKCAQCGQVLTTWLSPRQNKHREWLSVVVIFPLQLSQPLKHSHLSPFSIWMLWGKFGGTKGGKGEGRVLSHKMRWGQSQFLWE